MNFFILLSLLVAPAAVLIELFFTKEKKGVRVLLAVLCLLGAALAIYLTNSEIKEGKELKETVKSSKQILESTNGQLLTQSGQIDAAFSQISRQLGNETDNNNAILKAISQLQGQVKSLTHLSVAANNEVLGILKENNPAALPTDDKYIRIPIGDYNARQVDSKNQFAVSASQPADNNKLRIEFNGVSRTLAPSDRVSFKNEAGVACYFSYMGVEDNQYKFYVQARQGLSLV